MCYAQMKKWDKSLRDADKAISLNKSWEKGFYRRGVALMALGNPKEAMDAFQTCTQLKPDNDDFRKSYDQARKELFKGLSDSEILKIEGNEFFKTGKIQDAINKYTVALNKIGDKYDEKMAAVKADLHANRAACYVQLYEPVKVKEDCDAALKIDNKHIKALLRRAQAYESLEKYKSALADFDNALALDPNCDLASQGTVRIRNALRRLGELK
jgi:DnaJ family protein C protein 7